MMHGGNIREISKKFGIEEGSLLDFSANINPLGVPNSLKRIMMEAIDDLVNYPDIHYHDLKNAIGEKYKLSFEDIYVGNGGVQVIFDFVKAVSPKKALVVYPTFGEYERALEAVGSEIKEFFLQETLDFQLNMEALIEEIDGTLDLVVLCNPNNPTGTLIKKENLIKLLDHCIENNVYLMVDEAFMDFADEGDIMTLLKEVSQYKNLLVTRSFTKFYGIPGLRLGFGACSDGEIKSKLNQSAIPWTVNTFASYFGRVLLEGEDYENRTHQWLKEETARFIEELKALGLFKIYQPSANYILMKILSPELNVATLRDRLIEDKILIRDCSNFKGLDNSFLRIAIKDTKVNDQLVRALKNIRQY